MSGDRTRRFNRLAELRQRELDKEAAAQNATPEAQAHLGRFA